MVKDKTPGVTKAKKKLEAYYKANNLDLFIDWRKDPIHGKMVTKLINRLNIERDKLAYVYPTRDLKNEVKLIKFSKMKKDKKAKEAAEKEAKKKLVKKSEGKANKEAKKEKKEKSPRVMKYDYPLIDGREMNATEKKKYRMEQRKLAAGENPKPKKEKEGKKDAPVKKEKASKKVSTKKVEKKSKKAKKEED